MKYVRQLDFLVLLVAVFAVVSGTSLAQSTSSVGGTVAYTADPNGPWAGGGYGNGLNIGHLFTVLNTNIQVQSLGAFNWLGNGLSNSHPVSIFTNNGDGTFTQVPGLSVVVPGGTAAPLIAGHRFEPLPTPVYLVPGNYAIIAFQMNQDPFTSPNGTDTGLNGDSIVYDQGEILQYVTNSGPGFPSPVQNQYQNVEQQAGNYGSVSFTYNVGTVSPVTSPILSPSNTYASSGQTVTLFAATGGSPPINYQWYYNGTTNPIPGATNSTLVLTNIQATNAGTYSVSVQNSLAGPLYSTNPLSAVITVIPTPPPINIMPLGDSITYGFRSFEGGYPAPLYVLCSNNNYNINFIGTFTTDNYPTNLPYPNNEGVSGSVISSVASGYTVWINEVPSPTIVLLMIGTNNFGDDDDPDGATNELDNLVQEICTNSPPTTALFVANLTLRTDNPTAESEIETLYNPYIPGIVAKHVAMGQRVYFVDMHDALVASDLSDGLHPNDVGYAKMAKTWFNAITNVFRPLSGSNPSLVTTSGYAAVRYIGFPGAQYSMQRSTNMNCTNWVTVGTNAVPSTGLLQMVDPFVDLGGQMPQAAFYRLIKQ